MHASRGRTLIGRQAESDDLVRHLAAARAGDGGVIYIEAPAGAGKSRLLALAADGARDEGMLVLQAAGHELERSYPFGIATQLLEESSLAADADGRAQRLDGPARSAHRWLTRTADERPEVPDDDGFGLIHALYALVRSLARPAAAGETGRAVALVVDDVNRADDPSLRWLAYLSARITELPVAIVVSARTGEPSTNHLASMALRDAAGEGVLRPGGLSADAVEQIVRAELPGAADSIWQGCAQVTGGNPFLLTELLAELRRIGAAEAIQLADRLESVAPDSITRSVSSQLATLGDPATQLAFAVAVLGDDASLQRAADLADLDVADALHGADALTATQILRAGAPLAFRHPIVATAVRAAIPSFQRDRMHRRAGPAPPPPDISAAAPSISAVSDVQAVPVRTGGTHEHDRTGSAGQSAAEKLTADELERCLEIVGDLPGPRPPGGSPVDQAADDRSRAWSLYHQGRIGAALAAAQAGLEALPTEERAKAHGLNGALAACAIQRGELDQAEAALSMLVSVAEVPDTELAVLFDVRAQLRLAQRRAAEATEDAEEAGARARSIGAGSHPGIVAWRSTAAFARLARSEPFIAEQLAEEELALARETDLPRVTIRALRALGLAATGERRLDLLAEAVGAGRDRPVRLEYLHALVDLGAATRRANRRTAAREILEEALELCRHHGATALAQQALAEIAGTGAPRRRPLVIGVGSLTPSERRVAELAADGRTTQQIAAELFVTPKTVEFHLRHIYRKLEVASTRAELTKAVRAGALTADGNSDSSPVSRSGRSDIRLGM